MSAWALANPWLTFFLAIAALQVIGNVIVLVFTNREQSK